MPRIAFDDLPRHGRLWVFPATETLTDSQTDGFLEAVDAFLDGWAAHGVPLRSGRKLIERRFLLVGVDEDAEAPSGCSIDALVNQLRGLGSQLGVSIIDHAPVWYRDGEEIRCVSRAHFRALAEKGGVDSSTPVFDTTLTRVEEADALERSAAESWHGRAFFGAPTRG